MFEKEENEDKEEKEEKEENKAEDTTQKLTQIMNSVYVFEYDTDDDLDTDDEDDPLSLLRRLSPSNTHNVTKIKEDEYDLDDDIDTDYEIVDDTNYEDVNTDTDYEIQDEDEDDDIDMDYEIEYKDEDDNIDMDYEIEYEDEYDVYDTDDEMENKNIEEENPSSDEESTEPLQFSTYKDIKENKENNFDTKPSPKINEEVEVKEEEASSEIKLKTENKCEQCPNAFIQPGRLKEHIRVHSDKPYKCKVRQKEITEEIQIKEHTEASSEVKLKTGNKCEQCSKAFIQPGCLKEHIQVHSDKPYKCKVRQKEIAEKIQIKEHMEKPPYVKYKSDQCGKSINCENDIRNHTRNTNKCGECRGCNECRNDFNKNYQLKKHISDYSCKKCSQRKMQENCSNEHTIKLHEKG